MPLLNCATAALCGSVHLGKRLGPAFCLILKVFNLWVGNCTKLHWAAIRENVCSGAENFPWSHPGSWCSFVQHSNLFHPESPLGKVPQEAKEKFDFQDTVVINEILLAAAVYCSTKQWTKESFTCLNASQCKFQEMILIISFARLMFHCRFQYHRCLYLTVKLCEICFIEQPPLELYCWWLEAVNPHLPGCVRKHTDQRFFTTN